MIDEHDYRCTCGHLGSEHEDMFAPQSRFHGPLRCVVEGCDCHEYEWDYEDDSAEQQAEAVQ